MGSMGNFNASDLNKFKSELEKMERSSNEFIEACAKELAARLLAMAVKRTPVGDYSGEPYECAAGQQHEGHKVRVKDKNGKVKGKVGGTLRRGWTNGGKISAKAIKENAQTMKVSQEGDIYTIEIINPVEYASYVEYGHRKVNNKGWVPGHFMMTISAQKLQEASPQILERKIKRYMKGLYDKLGN